MSPSNPSAADYLRTLDAFGHLSPSQTEALASIAFLKRYETDEIVFYEEEESRHFHFLAEGEISIVKSSAVTDTIALHRFPAPSMIAEMATLKGIPYPATAHCVRPSLIVKISREPFLSLLGNDPSLGITIMASLMAKISALETALQRHSAPTALCKVARLLREDLLIFSRLKGTEIAQLLGLTPETLSRMLTRLKTESVIVPSGSGRGYTLVDPVKLDAFADNNFPLKG